MKARVVSGALTQVIADVLGKKNHLNITIWAARTVQQP
jgi:hypothetical protein